MVKSRLAVSPASKLTVQAQPVEGSTRAERYAGKGRPYDKRAWRDGIRPAKLRQDPLCADHLDKGRSVAASEVDHVDGDPANNAPENLRSLCKPCHSAKTARHDGSFGRKLRRA